MPGVLIPGADSHWAEAALWGACCFLLPRVKVIMLQHFPSPPLSFSYLLFPQERHWLPRSKMGGLPGQA